MGRPRSRWHTLRDRFAHVRGALPGSPERLADAAGSSAQSEVGTDSLFTELARAFSLSVDHESPPSTSPQSQDTRASPASSSSVDASSSGDGVPRAPAAEGVERDNNFEQFLISLQRDLRIALAQISTEDVATSGTARDDTRSAQAADTLGERSSVSHNPGSVGSPRDFTHDSTSPTFISDDPLDRQSGPGEGSHRVDDVDNCPNANGEIERSEVDGGPSSSSSSAPALASSSTNILPPSIPLPNSLGSGQDGGISWWRVHRFPPISARQQRQQGGPLNVGRQPGHGTNQAEAIRGTLRLHVHSG